jgi:hypothetical protein
MFKTFRFKIKEIFSYPLSTAAHEIILIKDYQTIKHLSPVYTVISITGSIGVFHRITPKIQVKLRYFDKNTGS